MATTSGSFTAQGNTITHPVMKRGETVTVAISGTYNMVIELQRATSSAQLGWEVLESWSTANATVAHDHTVSKDSEILRLFVRTDTSGTATVSLSDSVQSMSTVYDTKGGLVYEVTDDGVKFQKALQSVEGNGTLATVTGLTVKEYGDGAIHKTVFTLDSVAVPVVSVTTGAGVGGTKLYDFPTAAILRLGCTADLAMAIDAGDQADFTDGTPEGDVGIGTVIMANADAFGTDATDDDWGTGVAFVGSSYADADIEVASEAVGIHPEGALDLNLNALVDAADIDDSTTSALQFTGTITIIWANLGEYAA
jgi:hypothetical protein